MRCKVKDLKKFLEDKADDLDVFVSSYDSNHHKEFLYLREYLPGDLTRDTEILIAKCEKDCIV